MRLAVISDIHGNHEAFKQVLLDTEQAGVEAIVCLGDNIGYGPEPEAVVARMRELAIPCVMGNHELAVAEPSTLDWFNDLARRSILLTAELLSEESLEYCRTLPTSLVVEQCACVHGCPPDSVLTYILEPSDRELIRRMKQMPQDICFVGHTHLLEIIRLDDRGLQRAPLFQSRIHLPEGPKYLINAGSVGQPRDGNNNAKYLIWDDDARLLEVRFVPYDIAATVNKILDLGWPPFHARRLW